MKKEILFENKKVIYTVEGEGKVVLLVHGYCENRQVWNNLLAALPGGYKYIIPDLPGAGESEVAENVSMKYFADVVNAIVQNEKADTFIFIGHSMGGYVAMEYAKNYIEKLNGLGLFHSHVFADDENKKAGRYKTAEFIASNGLEKYVEEFVPKLFSKKTPNEIIDAQISTLKSEKPAGFIAALKAMAARTDTSDVLAKIPFTVLFIFGSDDSIMPLNNLLPQCEIPAVSQTEILYNSGHMGMLEETQKCADSISEYLNTNKLHASNKTK